MIIIFGRVNSSNFRYSSYYSSSHYRNKEIIYWHNKPIKPHSFRT